jgi:hypothetical protein
MENKCTLGPRHNNIMEWTPPLGTPQLWLAWSVVPRMFLARGGCSAEWILLTNVLANNA